MQTKKLSLNKETVRTLNSGDTFQVDGGKPPRSTSILTVTIELSVEWCGSRNGCASLDTCQWSGITTQPC